jgi:hypothetical protein
MWEDNIKMVLLRDVDWINLAPDKVQWHALVNLMKNFMVPQNADIYKFPCINKIGKTVFHNVT